MAALQGKAIKGRSVRLEYAVKSDGRAKKGKPGDSTETIEKLKQNHRKIAAAAAAATPSVQTGEPSAYLRHSLLTTLTHAQVLRRPKPRTTLRACRPLAEGCKSLYTVGAGALSLPLLLPGSLFMYLTGIPKEVRKKLKQIANKVVRKSVAQRITTVIYRLATF